MQPSTELALTEARRTLDIARQSRADALGRIESQKAAILEAEGLLSELSESAADSTENIEAAADWRRKRAGLGFEVEGLRQQLDAMLATVEKRSRTVSDAEQLLGLAEAAYFDQRILEIMPALKKSMEVVLDSWSLYCRRHWGASMVDDRKQLANWLWAAGAPFDLEKQDNPARQRRTAAPATPTAD